MDVLIYVILILNASNLHSVKYLSTKQKISTFFVAP